ncbi:uncharacterized protein LOC141594799 [Silene latifolia]|uniref:uncharacterized protein LOC141594799 n=1 Tax=Silene latifolia TaxID=37657 RepID=UPI003D7871D2
MSMRRLLLSNNQRICSSFLQKTRNFSAISASHPIISPSINPCSSPKTPTFSSSLFLKEFRRGFAKGRKTKGDTDVVIEDIGPSVKSTAVSQMEAAVDALSRELTKLRTGRATIGMLDHIIVETRGVKMNLNRLALVTIVDHKTLAVTPYDAETIKELEKAIVSSPLGLNPRTDGQRLVAAIPPLTKEHIQAINKVVSKSSEDVKQSIRRSRQKALDAIKKAGYPKDSTKRFEKEIDELTKKYVKSAEDMCKAKEKEISAG